MSARILIADDSPLVLKSVRTLLESHTNGWKVCAEAANGAEALEKALATKPDLIIMDFQMPSMDGLRTSPRIVKFLPNVPILMNTNHKSSFLDAEAQKVGVREVIMKSDSGQLLRAVKESLRKFPATGTQQKRSQRSEHDRQSHSRRKYGIAFHDFSTIPGSIPWRAAWLSSRP